MSKTRIVPMVLASFLILACQFDAISPSKIRKLPRALVDAKSEQKVSPAPSPGSGGPKGPGNEADSTGRAGCLASSEACNVKDLSACLRYVGNAPKEAFLVLGNSGDIPLKVNVTFVPANITSDDIQLAKKKITEVNVTTKIQGSSSIALNAGDGDCVIVMKPPASGGNFYMNFPYASQVKPVHGVYLFLATVFLIGGVWACYKFGKDVRHVDGITYQELEMGQTQADSTLVVDAEMAEGWDESWDDDWGDEIREVKSSPNRIQVGNGSANGHQSVFQ